MSLANNMEGKFPSKILVFVTDITHNCDSFSYWSQIFYILPSICEDFILPSQIRFFESAFWVRQKFLIANRHFSCSVVIYIKTKIMIGLKKKKKKKKEGERLTFINHFAAHYIYHPLNFVLLCQVLFVVKNV